MTAVQSALRFLQQLREDSSLRTRLASQRATLGVSDLVALGAERAWSFDEAALRQAFVHDWQMRMAHWQLQARRSAPPDDAQVRVPA